MNKSFAQLFEESMKNIETSSGSMIRGTVISINKDMVLVDTGLKSESNIPIDQFRNSKGEIEIHVGDQIDVILDALENGFGETILSREKARRHEAWSILEKSYKSENLVLGTISNKVKGGFTIDLSGIRAFLPGSLVDIRPVKDTLHLEGKELEFKIIKLDQKRNNIVVSRRAVIESENNSERTQLLENIEEGINIKGVVKNVTDYGAFIDLGGIDGLLHITDMSWKRIKHPNEIVNLGDEIVVKILKFDKERMRVSLGLKQITEDPWISIVKQCPEKTILTGHVTNITDYGCFVEIQKGIEGLVHISEMDWTNKNINPSKIVSVGQFLKVMILDIDTERRRISLGLKQCQINPWQKFAEINKKGDYIKGEIKSITDFGIFVGLEGGIDGLIHFSDISWKSTEEDVLNKYKKGDEITAIILQIDSERERISLGMKQLEKDPLSFFFEKKKKGAIIHGIIKTIDKNNVIVQLSEHIEGCLCISELSSSYKNDFLSKKNVGDFIDVKLCNFDKKNRVINVTLHINKTNKENKNVAKNNGDKISNVMEEAFRTATKD